MASTTLRFARLFFQRWAGWVTCVLLAASLGLAPVLLRGGEPYGGGELFNVFSLLLLATLWTGFALGHQLHEQLIRPGTSLVPGYRENHVRAAISLGSILVASMILVLFWLGLSGSTAVALALPALALGLMLGLALGIQLKSAVLGFVLALGLYVNITNLGMTEARSSRQLPWHWWGGIDPLWQKAALISVGIGLLWVLSRWVGGMRESAFPFRVLQGSEDVLCSELEGKLPEPLMLLLPGFARRRVPPLARGRSMARSWRLGTMPLTTLGYALIMSPFMMLMVAFGRSEPVPEVYNNALLFQANGLIVLITAHTRARLQQELLRPASREQILSGMARACSAELAQYWLCVSVVHVAVHALLDPTKLTMLGYWGQHVLSLGLLAFGLGLGLWLARWTRWSGLIAFLLIWIAAVLAAQGLLELQAPLPLWGLASAMAGVHILWLLPLARWSWLRAEVGRG